MCAISNLSIGNSNRPLRSIRAKATTTYHFQPSCPRYTSPKVTMSPKVILFNMSRGGKFGEPIESKIVM